MDFHQTPFRHTPALPVGAVQSYEIYSPVLGVRQITCEQAGCERWRDGWTTIVDTSSVQAQYIRTASGRRFIETREGSMVTFRFPPGQRCFASGEHREFAHAPDVFALRPGDWRGTAGEVRRFNGRHGADDWVDSFANHQLKIAEIHQRG
jgi:hypothetical protein